MRDRLWKLPPLHRETNYVLNKFTSTLIRKPRFIIIWFLTVPQRSICSKDLLPKFLLLRSNGTIKRALVRGPSSGSLAPSLLCFAVVLFVFCSVPCLVMLCCLPTGQKSLCDQPIMDWKFCNCGSKFYSHKSVFSGVLLQKADQHKVKKKSIPKCRDMMSRTGLSPFCGYFRK